MFAINDPVIMHFTVAPVFSQVLIGNPIYTGEVNFVADPAQPLGPS